MKNIDRQLKLELEGINEGIAKTKQELERANAKGGYGETMVSSILVYQLLQPFRQGLTEYKNSRTCSTNDRNIKDFLEKVGYSEAAYIAVKVLFNNIVRKDLKATTLSTSITRALLTQLNVENLKKMSHAKGRSIENLIKHKLAKNTSREQLAKDLNTICNTQDGFDKLELSQQDQLLIGQKLLDILMKKTGLFSIELSTPHFGRKAYVIEVSQKFREYFKRIEGECELLTPVLYPMVTKPMPYSPDNLGGFYTPSLRTPLVKNRSGKPNAYLKGYAMPKVYEAVNALQDVSWKINKKVLEVLTHYVNMDKEFKNLDIPSGTEVAIVPRPIGLSDMATPEEHKAFKEAHPKEYKDWVIAKKAMYIKQVSDRGKRLLLVSQLATATKFKDEPEIYYCYNLDWRGRVYPIQSGGCPNPQGNDISKALLMFANGVALGAEGAKWLSMLGANTFGDDKLPMSERWTWAKAHEQDILAVAKDPYENKWWFEADEPFKFLAFCFEWGDYVASGYSPEFLSYLPVPLDGSCSGIQHFSALLRDERGALATNVINGAEDKPNDIYAEVAKEVSRAIDVDVANGVPEAKALAGKIDRTIVKRNTMTTPYGVKHQGMIDQLYDELSPNDFDLTDTTFHNICKYLASQNARAISKVVIGSKLAMDFLRDMAKVMNLEDKVFFWTTPSGFKVKQEYLQKNSTRVDTLWGGSRIRLNIEEQTQKINHVKTTNGKSPNLIHSMDAAHLINTIYSCIAEGISSFAMIHDSFATHAGNTDILRDTLRKEFVGIYSENQLARFRDEIASQLSHKLAKKLPEVPSLGALDITKVLNSTYFFS